MNAAHAAHLQIRHLALTGALDAAEAALETVDATAFTPMLRAAHELVIAGIAIRRIRAIEAASALDRAAEAASHVRIAGLAAEVEEARRLLASPAARLIAHGETRELRLADVDSRWRAMLLSSMPAAAPSAGRA